MGARALLGPALSGFALALACRAPAPAPADIVLLGGRIATVEPGAGEVQALAARDGRIVALGTDAEVERLVGPRTRVLRLAGRRAVPGFVEGHGHLVGLGESLRILDLRGTRSFDEVVALVARAARETAPGEWILGRGWHQEAWERPPSEHVEGFPTHHALSAATPDHPVALTHASGHASLFDDDAMRLAGVDGSTPDPAGGEILRLADGRPSGLFRESAAALVERVLEERLARRSAAERRAELRETVRRAERECLGKGVTSFQDAGASLETVALLREMAEGGELDLRLWVMLRDDPERLRGYPAAVVKILRAATAMKPTDRPHPVEFGRAFVAAL